MEEIVLIFGEIDITPLLRAQKAFEYSLNNILEMEKQEIDLPLFEHLRDGAIQRFEFTVELTWKTLKNILFYYHIDAKKPRDIITLAAQEGILDFLPNWLIFLKARNKTSHIYKKEVYQILPDFQEKLNELIHKILKLQARLPFE